MRVGRCISINLWTRDTGNFPCTENMSLVLWIVAGLMVLRLLGESLLSLLNRAEVRRHSTKAPTAVAAIMDDATYQKSVAYTLENSRFGQLTGFFDTLVLMLVIFGGALPWLYSEVVGWGGPEAVWSRTIYLLLVGVLLAMPGLPFEWWSQFRLEEKFGFNKSTPKLWFMDKVKGLTLMLVIGFALIWVLLSLVTWVGNSWWIWGEGENTVGTSVGGTIVRTEREKEGQEAGRAPR